MKICILEVLGSSLGSDTSYLELIRDFPQSLHERNWYSRLHSLRHDLFLTSPFQSSMILRFEALRVAESQPPPPNQKHSLSDAHVTSLSFSIPSFIFSFLSISNLLILPFIYSSLTFHLIIFFLFLFVAVWGLGKGNLHWKLHPTSLAFRTHIYTFPVTFITSFIVMVTMKHTKVIRSSPTRTICFLWQKER